MSHLAEKATHLGVVIVEVEVVITVSTGTVYAILLAVICIVFDYRGTYVSRVRTIKTEIPLREMNS